MVVKPSTERKVKRGRPSISEATKALVIRLYNEDEPCKRIAEACNISESSVFRIIRNERSKA